MVTNNDLISVIIPAYNHEKYVQETLNSVIKQTYDNLELIVIDDGSTDTTWEKIQEMKDVCEQRFKRVIFEKQDNSGIVAMLNKALFMIRGKYLYYIASDDVAHPQAIEKLHANIEDASFIFPDIAWIDSDSVRFYLNRGHEKVYKLEQAEYKSVHEAYTNLKWPDIDDLNFDFYGTLLEENCLNIGGLLRIKSVRDIGGWKGKGIEDYYMHLQIAKKYKIKRLKKVLFFYRRHENNWSNNKWSIYYDLIRIFKGEMLYCYAHGYVERWNDIYKRKYRMNDNDCGLIDFFMSVFSQAKRKGYDNCHEKFYPSGKRIY